jgi:hypothetical protein
VVLSLLGLTALTSLSQRWNTLSWLAGVVAQAQMRMLEVEAVRVVCYLLQDFLLQLELLTQ